MSVITKETLTNRCYICNRQLGNPKAIEEHAIKKHSQYLNGNYKKKVYGCSDCDFQSDLQIEAKRHVKTHNNVAF